MERIPKVSYISNFNQKNMKKNIRLYCEKIGVYITLCSLFLVTIEICSRIDDKIKYSAPFLSNYSHNMLTSRDSDGVRYNVPNARFEKWKNNSIGFRGNEIQLNKKEGVIRVACMGTSESYGLYENEGNEWPEKLNQHLNSYKNIEVINTSVVGLRLRMLKQYLQNYVFRVNPDIIIIFINPYSVARGFERKHKIQANKNNLDSNRTSKSLPTIEKKITLSTVVSNARCLPKIKQSIKKIVPTKLLRKYQLLDTLKQLEQIETERLKGKTPLDDISESHLVEFENQLHEIVDFVKMYNVSPILCTYPSLISKESIQKYPEIILDYRKFFVEFSTIGLLNISNRYNKIVELYAEKNQIEFIDLNKILNNDIEYFADNVHYTNLGATLIAETISEHIIKKVKYFQRT